MTDSRGYDAEEPSAVRLSCAYFINDHDIERLVAAVSHLAAT